MSDPPDPAGQPGPTDRPGSTDQPSTIDQPSWGWAGPWERREYWRRQQRDLRRRRSVERRRAWHNARAGHPTDQATWGDGPAPWGDGPPPWGGRSHPGMWILGRVVPIVIGLVLVVALTTAAFAWLVASLLGLFGAGPTGGGPLIVLARIAGVGLVVLGVVSIVRRVRGLGEPIAELAEATSRIEAGDYTVRVDEPDRGAPELLGLARGFNTMAARLEADERQRRALLADVSHELRTPLAVVQGNVEALVDGIHPPDGEHLGAILDETRVLGRLIDDLRTVALSEAGTLPLHREPTDLCLLVADVARSFETVATAAGTALSVTTAASAGDLPLLDLDPVRIREVLSNLVANALRYAPAGTAIEITIDRETSPDAVSVRVRDHGPGLPPEVAEHAFDRFARSVDSTGSGLGLAIARYLVAAHGGRIGLSSPTDGGTMAWFSLPLARA